MPPEFSAQVSQNPYLPPGGTDVHAIVTVTCSGAGGAGSGGAAAAEAVLIDCSGSMQNPAAKIYAARRAGAVAVDEIVDGTWFCVIRGADGASLVYPASRQASMARMDSRTREEARQAVRQLAADGGTAIGSWLTLAARAFDATDAVQRHALLLTDGQNQHETHQELLRAVRAVKGRFQCDCRGVGDDWVVDELRMIATELLGSVDLIADPAAMEADFKAVMQTAMGRGVSEVALQVWAPQGSQVLFVRQVAPAVDDLTQRRTVVNPLTGSYPTGAWGNESRDYHLAVRVPTKPVGTPEMLAGRVKVMVDATPDPSTQGLVKVIWSDDDTMTTRIDRAVAHYTGQAELAQVIQEGLAAKAAGDEVTATVRLGRAAQLAAQTGNDEATDRLRKVVDIEDADSGTVRLKAKVAKLDEMALDTASTKTTRVRP